MDHPRSWYAATANPHAPFPRLDGDLSVDVAVLGGGYTGLSTALDLAARGFSVAVLEARRVGWGASGRNGGQAVTGYNRGIAALAARVGAEDARRLWDFAEEAKTLLSERVETLGIDCDLRWGYLFAATKRRQIEELKATLREWIGLDYHRGRMVSRAELAGLVAAPGYVGGLLDTGSGQLHPLNYALGLAEGARRAGVRIFEDTEVTRLVPGDPAALETRRGTIRARFVALCGNAYLPGGLDPMVDRVVRPRIMPVATYMIATEPMDPERAARLVPSGFAVADVNFVLNYFRLSADHRLLFGGGVSYSGWDAPWLARQLERTMTRTLPGTRGLGAAYCWGGNVAITLDRTPHLGRLAPNIYFAQGYSGHGVLLTGMAGRTIAEAIAGQAQRFDVFARLPHRPFPGGRGLRMPALVLAMTWYRLRDLL